MNKAIGFVVLAAVLALAVAGQQAKPKPEHGIITNNSAGWCFYDVVKGTCEAEHRWASDLLKEKRSDGCRWVGGFGSIELQCPTGEPEIVWRGSVDTLGGDRKPAWEVKERHTLDWCIAHDPLHFRTLREDR